MNPTIHQSALNRRAFLRTASSATLAATCLSFTPTFAAERGSKKITVGAHPWVYAAKQPQYDITPILDTIFADLSYAGMGGDRVDAHGAPAR